MDVLGELLQRLEESVISSFFDRDAFSSLIPYLGKKKISLLLIEQQNTPAWLQGYI